MKASIIKTDKRVESKNDRSLGIQSYGAGNDYPQRVSEIINASGTGKSCVNIYSKFISGRGFQDLAFSKVVINRGGETTDTLLNLLTSDLALFGGFAFHVNYNAIYEPVSIHHIPFEHTRFVDLDENGNFNKIAIHNDWGQRNILLKKFSKDDIVFIDLFNPQREIIKKQIDSSGGWNGYNGQVFYYSNNGRKVYPTPIFDPALTDMSTEEGLSNIKLRNARNNFLPAGMLVSFNNVDESSEQTNTTHKMLMQFNTDFNVGKLMHIEVRNEAETPQFVPFKANNYDKDFEVTERTVIQNIGRAFNQPPILRAEDVGSNFGADMMRNAYDFYNSITEKERRIIEDAISQIFTRWHDNTANPQQNYLIEPLTYVGSQQYSDIPIDILKYLTPNERRSLIGFQEIKDDDNNKQLLAEKLGVGGTQSLIEVVKDEKMSPELKAETLKLLFGLSDEEATRMTKDPRA